MSWLTPCRKCRSASAFISSGVARNTGEWSQVQVSVEVTGRGRPSRGGEAPPLRPFAFGQIHQRIARKRHRRYPVGLRTESRPMLFRPCRHGRGGGFVAGFGEGL